MKVMLDEGAYPIERAHEADAGYDIRTPIDVKVPGKCHRIECTDCYPNYAIIDTGVHVSIPKGYVGFLKSKSGLNVKHGLTGEGVIDSGYTGSIVVKLYNNISENYQFKRGDKLIQLVLLPVYTPEIEYVDSLDDTERGVNGFGSSGK